MIVGMCGAAGSGKDTAAQALIEQAGFSKLSYAGKLKSALNLLFGWDYKMWEDLEWKERPQMKLYGKTPREVAQTFGTDWGRNLVNDNLWVDLCMADAKAESKVFNMDHVITDVRFPNEAAAIRKAGGILIYVTCADRPTGTTSNEHESESWLPWLWLYADVEVTAAFGAIAELQEATLNVVENYRRGDVPRFEPSAETLAQLNAIEQEVLTRV